MPKLTDTELTRLVAEKVMGWEVAVVEYGRGKKGNFWVEAGSTGKIFSNPHWNCLAWHPLTDWAAAGEIVMKMRADGWSSRTTTNGWIADQCGCEFFRGDLALGKDIFSGSYEEYGFKAGVRQFAVESSGPRAITIAALLAVGAIS
jgi:hypothetical protein